MKTAKERHAEAMLMVGRWKYFGNCAADRGNHDLAERHFSRAQKWLDLMNELEECGSVTPGRSSRNLATA